MLVCEVAIFPAAVSIILIYPLKSLYLFSDLAALAAKLETKMAFQRQTRPGLPGSLGDMKLTCTVALQ